MEKPSQSPTCPICGHPVEPTAHRCPECGFELIKDVSPQVAPARPTPKFNPAVQKKFPVWAWILIIVGILACIGTCIVIIGMSGLLLWKSEKDPEPIATMPAIFENLPPSGVPDDQVPPDDSDGSTTFFSTPNPAEDQLEPEVLDTWFMQDPNTPMMFTYGFILHNPNSNLALVNLSVHAVAYDSNDTILGTSDSYVRAILPGQDFGQPGSGISLPDNTIVAKLEVQVVDSGQAYKMNSVDNLFTFDPINLFHDQYNSVVTAVMHYHGIQSLSGVNVSAVAYDAEGMIIGIGNSYEELYAPAGGEVPISMQMQVSTVPTRIQMYATFSPEMQPEVPSADQLPAVIDSGFSVDEYKNANFAVIIKNPSSAPIYQYLTCRVIFYDNEGNVLAVTTSTINSIFPGEKQAIQGSAYLSYIDKTETIDHVDVQVVPPSYSADSLGFGAAGLNSNPLSTDKITYFAGDYQSKVTAILKNSSDLSLQSMLVLVLYDSDGKIIGGAQAYPPQVDANQEVAIEIPIYQAIEPAKMDVFASISNIVP